MPEDTHGKEVQPQEQIPFIAIILRHDAINSTILFWTLHHASEMVHVLLKWQTLIQRFEFGVQWPTFP